VNTHFDKIITFIRAEFKQPENFIPLHEPRFSGNEKKYLNECIDSTFVSSVGKFVDEFEKEMASYTGAKYAVAIVNGTAALHIALKVAGVKKNDLVITQPLSFIATCNAISYLNAHPLFVDIDLDTLSLSPEKLKLFLKKSTQINSKGECVHIETQKRIMACVPMHSFGLPGRVDELLEICNEYNIKLIEDAAESIGSFYKNKHTGTFGLIGTFSFNGNKTITCGGGGAIVTDNEQIAREIKHLTTQAKVPHAWEFIHNAIAYNYRMPNINAALACAQLEQLNTFIEKKRQLADKYKRFFNELNIPFCEEIKEAKSNYWLNAILLKDKEERDAFLNYTNKKGVMTRPAWELMPNLEMFKNCIKEDITNSIFIADRLVNIPSSVILN
jgi:perosamine synthetase